MCLQVSRHAGATISSAEPLLRRSCRRSVLRELSNSQQLHTLLTPPSTCCCSRLATSCLVTLSPDVHTVTASCQSLTAPGTCSPSHSRRWIPSTRAVAPRQQQPASSRRSSTPGVTTGWEVSIQTGLRLSAWESRLEACTADLQQACERNAEHCCQTHVLCVCLCTPL